MYSARIIVIEDEAVVALDISNNLHELGYSVCGVADNGCEALSMVESQNPDVVLMDIVIKGAMDGIKTSAQIAEQFRTPVIFLTAFSDDATVKRAAETAPYGYLTKPFQPRELRAAIEVALYKVGLERRLRESERWFSSTLRCVSDGVVAVDTNADIRFLNLAAEQILGVTLEAAKGRNVADVLHFKDGHALPVVKALTTGSTVDIEFGQWLLNGTSAPVPVDHSAAPIRDDQNNLIGAVAAIRDVSERLAAEETLRASEERFRTAFNFAPVGMALVSMEGQFLQGNTAMHKLLDCDEIELLGLNIRDVTPAKDLALEQEQLARLLLVDTPWIQFEKRLQRKNHHAIWVLASASLLTHNESPFCYLYQFYDLTARRQAEALTKKQEKITRINQQARHAKELAEAASQAKTQFISHMSHELRTPLNAILGFAQLLDDPSDAYLSPQQRNYLEHIQFAGWHLLDLVNEVLDLGKIESGKLQLSMERVDLEELLLECINLIKPKARESDITVAVDGDAAFVVKVDRIRLRQTLLNLLSNAVKYNAEHGKITLTCTLSADRVRIAIRDTGPGLSDEQQKHLFEPFNRLGIENGTIEGSGIGLVITKRLVEAMGGRIGVDSVLGSGSVFWIELAGDQLAAPSKTADVEPGSTALTLASQSRPRTILCIEDNPVNLLLISKIVQQQAWLTLISANTGKKGFELALQTCPDLILSDIGLPDLSGLELIERLRANPSTRTIPAIAISAHAEAQYMQEALAAGFNRYLTKPIRLGEFLQMLQDLLTPKNPNDIDTKQ